MGVTATIIKGGRLQWAATYGKMNLESNMDVNDDTMFYQGSIGKTITAVAVMQLVETNHLALNGNVNDYLNEKNAEFNVGNPDLTDAREITITDLMTHTSGIKDSALVYGRHKVLIDGWSYHGWDPMGLHWALKNYFNSTHGWYYNKDDAYNGKQPGEHYEYCNVATGILGYLVEIMNPDGYSFVEYVKEKIFTPLKMDHTYFMLSDIVQDHGDLYDHLAMPYTYNSFPKLNEDRCYCTQIPFGYYSYPDLPSGCLKASVRDVSTFLSTISCDGQLDGLDRILTKESVDTMLDNENPLIFYTKDGMIGHGGLDIGAVARMFFMRGNTTGGYGYVIYTNSGPMLDYDASMVEPMLTALKEYAKTLPDVSSEDHCVWDEGDFASTTNREVEITNHEADCECIPHPADPTTAPPTAATTNCPDDSGVFSITLSILCLNLFLIFI